ncbi:MAG TPA: ChbG/HpnK family deacetylase [Rhizomicrobium sp.]|nr:ChbG/HpnK family deacetylase [Rhizomicrobium sp.]
MRLIVNADDLGATPRVNTAVFALMASGRIRSATLLANGRAFDEAVSRIGDFPHCSFGVHLNVATRMPVGPASELAPILGTDGQFRVAAVRRLFIPQSVRNAVLREWISQVARVKNAGVAVSHIDSHHHVHIIPGLFGTLKRLQRECGISRVRLAESRRGSRSLAAIPFRLGKAIWNRALRMDGTRTTDDICGLPRFETSSKKKYARSRTMEIMVHPGSRDAENKLLASEWWTQVMRDNEMISYNDL